MKCKTISRNKSWDVNLKDQIGSRIGTAFLYLLRSRDFSGRWKYQGSSFPQEAIVACFYTQKF